MSGKELEELLLQSPVIAAVQEEGFDEAITAPVGIVFCLRANILQLKERVAAAHAAKKLLFVHIDLAEGIGRDRAGVEYLASLGVDGVISTRTQLVKFARECGLLSVQRFFALDSKGVESIFETLNLSSPDLVEIMPGVVGKLLRKFSGGKVPVIAGGLVETKAELEEALSCGALAVSTGKKELWYL